MSTGREAHSSYAAEIAHALFHSQCLKFGSFRLKSGMVSPYYIDLSWLLSSPEDFRRIRNVIASAIKETGTVGKIDKLASVELKGALILPSVALQLELPCVVMRKVDKKYGLTGRIAGGSVHEDERILFFDDVISDGSSKIESIHPLEQLGAKIEHVVVVVDREQGGKENLASRGYSLRALTTISQLARCLSQSSQISEEQETKVLNYIEDTKRGI